MMKKNIYKYLLTALLILLLSSQILGCYNYREINKITFVTSMIFGMFKPVSSTRA